MAAVLVEAMGALSLDKEPEVADLMAFDFKVSGLGTFTLELEPETSVRDVKKVATEECNIAPEYMRLIHAGRELKDADVFTQEMLDKEEPVPTMSNLSKASGAVAPSAADLAPYGAGAGRRAPLGSPGAAPSMVP